MTRSVSRFPAAHHARRNSLIGDRIRHLQEAPVAVRFLSVEPLIRSVGTLPLDGIHWVIVGGESGGGWREMKLAWARKVPDQCLAPAVPLFCKQHSAFNPKTMDRLLYGREWNERPILTEA